MKQFTVILLMLGVALAGFASVTQARGMGWGRGAGSASCPAWGNASYAAGPATGPAMMRGGAMRRGPGQGMGYAWMRGAPAVAPAAVKSAPAATGQPQL